MCGGWSLGMKGEERREFMQEGNQKEPQKEGFLSRRWDYKNSLGFLGWGWDGGEGGCGAPRFKMTTRMPPHQPTFQLSSVSTRFTAPLERLATGGRSLIPSRRLHLLFLSRSSPASPPLLSTPFLPPSPPPRCRN